LTCRWNTKLRAILWRVQFDSSFLGNGREGSRGSSRDSVDRSFLAARRRVGVMNRVLSLCAAVVVGVVLGRMFDGVPMTAAAGAGGEAQGGGTGGVAGNGDVNGDRNINISDATYLLNWLFLGGPEPVACPEGSGPSGLPDTGQMTCYGAAGAVIDCASATCPGQDGDHATGCPSGGRFVDNGDGTVTDNCTGLMWQQNTADVDGNGQVTSEGDVLDWCAALVYCENLSFAGHDDWRLPNVRELQSLIDYGRFNPAIAPLFGALSSYYWSSTSNGGFDPVYAWGVYFGFGDVDYARKTVVLPVRAVRSGP
jgi:hypothetical protein